MVYEPRRDEPVIDRLPTDAIGTALALTNRIWGDLADDEQAQGLPRSREPQFGFVWAVFRWARQDRLDKVLTTAAQHGTELSAGDFIRWCKQVLDLLDQIASAPGAGGAPTPVAATARAAMAAVRRGVVAQSMQA
jgi:ATP-dependent RNA helicase HelY